MKYGYTIANAASRDVFDRAVPIIIDGLHFKPSRDYPEDVDGSTKKEFVRDDAHLVLENDAQVGCVDIISDIELPITCLHEWTEP